MQAVMLYQSNIMGWSSKHMTIAAGGDISFKSKAELQETV